MKIGQLYVNWGCIAWHWKWSITWRWIFSIRLRDKTTVRGWHYLPTHQGEAFMFGHNGLIFDVWFQTQPNMRRTEDKPQKDGPVYIKHLGGGTFRQIDKG